MPPRLKVKTGCRTCLARKKKCDEAQPKCGHCARLGLNCIRRDDPVLQLHELAISSTNLRVKTPLRVTLSNGYPPFRNELERQITLESSHVLRPLVSRMAGSWYLKETLFGRFCTQNSLVREAVVAFSAYGQQHEDSYKLSLRSYQNCVVRLQSTRAYENQDPVERDAIITAIVFLGLFEALKLGQPVNAIFHFEACKTLLSTRLSQLTGREGQDLLNLYRMVAECIIFNLGSMSPYQANIAQAAGDWGSAFDYLFGTDRYLSPFLGGFQGVYQVMFRINVLLRQTEADRKAGIVHDTTLATFEIVWKQLADLEERVPTMYDEGNETEDLVNLYRAKNRVTIFALRIHLLKIVRPSAVASDKDIRSNLLAAIAILESQDVREPGNPALMWPLSILACAAELEPDFQFIVNIMQKVGRVLDPGSAQKLAAAHNVLARYRNSRVELNSPKPDHRWPADQLDFLLEPQSLQSDRMEGLG